MIFAYFRVSTEDKQDFLRQEYILKHSDYDIEERNIFTDKKTGKDTNREQYQILKKIVRAGDIVVVPELSRFSRNYHDISNEMLYFKNLGVKLIFLDLPFLNSGDDLTSELIADITIKLFAYVAQRERENTTQRIKTKLTAMKAAGVKLGRPLIELNEEQEEILFTYLYKKPGFMDSKETAKAMGLNINTFYRTVKKYRDKYGIEKNLQRPKK